ncbi:hypothetical protein NQZ68_007636 [Dissostichus eleginoides]|nr:hypothetical protein NQZ68_007636 [Dissostichus eleginoides]
MAATSEFRMKTDTEPNNRQKSESASTLTAAFHWLTDSTIASGEEEEEGDPEVVPV